MYRSGENRPEDRSNPAPAYRHLWWLQEEQRVRFWIRSLMEDHVSNISRCVICMIEFNVGDSVRYLPCMHIYHVEVLIVSLLWSPPHNHTWFWFENVNNLKWRWRTIPNINTCSASTTGWCAPSLVQVVWSPWMLHFWVGAPRPCKDIILDYFSLFQWPMITSGCEVLFGGSKLFVIWTVTSNP